MKDRKEPLDYLRLAMNASEGIFAWHLFGVLNAMHDAHHPTPRPADIAREYLATFHAEALKSNEIFAEAELSLETSTIGN